MEPGHFKFLIAVLMVATGSINTLSTKWADTIESEGQDGVVRKFSHPFVQAVFMFVGEMMCLLAFKIMYHWLKRRQDGSENEHELTKGNRSFNPLIFIVPALCDCTATSIMYLGLNLTYPSSFQILRGSVIVFVGILSVGFLNRVLVKREWSGIAFIILGLVIVGLSDFLSYIDPSFTKNNIITGDLLIIIAQIISSVQMVYEEHFVSSQDIPALQAVGWEGVFGFSFLSLALIPMYYMKVGPPFNSNATGSLENAIDALIQISNNWQLVLAIGGTIVSIAFFNFAGITVTKQLSATTRMVFDSIRTLVVWAASLYFGWQTFHGLQIFGFIGLIFGMCLYNNIFVMQAIGRCSRWYRNRAYGSSDPMAEHIINTDADNVEQRA